VSAGRSGTPMLRRRTLLAALAALAACATVRPLAAAVPSEGGTAPSAPAIVVTGTDGRERPLADLLAGKRTAVQLMFTGCSATCPIQGAFFAALAARVRAPDVQLLSLSIDALGDDPAALRAWQARFGRHPSWLAAVPKPADVDRLADFMRGRAGRRGTHTAQVFVFDADARLRHRSDDAPALGEVEALLAQLSDRARLG
jgi:protein SCO1/2